MVSAPESRAAVGLDFVRGIAAVAVVLYHVRAVSFPAFGHVAADDRSLALLALYGASNFGHEAVLIFFVLSGYLVLGPLLSRSRHFDPAKYAIDRSTRILLPLFPACMLMVAVAAASGEPLSAGSAAAHAVGLNEVVVATSLYNAPLWTISHEIWFYLFGAAVGLLSLNRRSPAALLILAAVALAFTSLNPLYLLFWIMGGAMAQLRLVRTGWLFLLGAAVVVGGSMAYELAEVGHPSMPPSWVGECLVALGITLCLPLLADRRLTQRFKSIVPFATGLSAFSYSLYLVHFPVLKLTELLVPAAPGDLGVALTDLTLRTAACFAASALFYFIFEANTERVRRYLRDRQAQARLRPESSPAAERG